MKKLLSAALSFVLALSLVLTAMPAKQAQANASGNEIAIGAPLTFTGTSEAGYTFKSADLGASETVGAMVFNISIDLPAEGDVAWNDWCGEALKVTTPDGVKFYDFGGAQVSWGVDVDGDDNADTTGVGTPSWVGTAANGSCTVVVPVNATEFTVDFYDNCWDSATDMTHYTVISATPIFGAVSGIETVAVGQEVSFTGTAAPAYTFKSSSATAGKASAVVFNASILLPAEGDVAWNDWCGELAKVTTADGERFYDFGGAQVSWGVDGNGDDSADTTGVGTDSWVGSAANGAMALVIPVGADDYTIDFYDNCWDSATDMSHYAINSATVVYGEGGPKAAADEALSKEQTAFLMFADKNWNYSNFDATLEAATTTVNGAGSYSVNLKLADVQGETTDPVTGAQVFCVDVVKAGAYYAQTGESFILKDLEILVDGKKINTDITKVATGDIEKNGNFRIEIYNDYGLTAGAGAIEDPANFTFTDSITVNFTLEIGNPYEKPSTAFLMFSDRNWAYGNWDATLESATTDVLGNGTYTVKLNAADVKGDAADPVNGAQVFCVDVLGIAENVPFITDITASDVKVICDGVEIPVDNSKIKFGDIEGLGNFRIEIYNEYGETAADSPIDFEGLTFADSIAVTFTLGGITYGAPYVEPEEVKEVHYEGEYHAGLQIQTNTELWIFRNGWDDETYGKGTPEYDGGLYSTTGLVNYAGTFNDIVIDGDGTYTVSLTGADFQNENHFSIIGVSTDIPYGGEAKFSNVSVKINGKELYTFDEGYINAENKNYVNILCQNEWNSDVKNLFDPMFPVDSVEITFTVSGLGYEGTGSAGAAETAANDAPVVADTTKTEEAPVVTETPVVVDEPAESSNNIGLIIGIIAAVVVIAGVVVFIVLKKKKN